MFKMKKVNQVITAISVIVGLILAGFFVYDRWIKPERIELEVNCIDATQLTKLPVIEDFKANLYDFLNFICIKIRFYSLLLLWF